MKKYSVSPVREKIKNQVRYICVHPVLTKFELSAQCCSQLSSALTCTYNYGRSQRSVIIQPLYSIGLEQMLCQQL